MSDIVINVENLGKKYIIGHQREGKASYKSFREAIANSTTALLHTFQNQKLRNNDSEKSRYW